MKINFAYRETIRVLNKFKVEALRKYFHGVTKISWYGFQRLKIFEKNFCLILLKYFKVNTRIIFYTKLRKIQDHAREVTISNFHVSHDEVNEPVWKIVSCPLIIFYFVLTEIFVYHFVCFLHRVNPSPCPSFLARINFSLDDSSNN